MGFEGPWIAMGDRNMQPSELVRAGWVDLVGGSIIAPRSVTCAGGAGTLIDYFVVSAAIAQLVQQVQVIDESPTTPHWPVRLTLMATSWGHKVLARRRPKAFPTELPIGPRQPDARSTGPGRREASQRTSNWPGWSGFGQPRRLGAGPTIFAASTAGLISEEAKVLLYATFPLARLRSAKPDAETARRRLPGRGGWRLVRPFARFTPLQPLLYWTLGPGIEVGISRPKAL